eukprot:6213868-Pleurochrysis_carterae.AAC.7
MLRSASRTCPCASIKTFSALTSRCSSMRECMCLWEKAEIPLILLILLGLGVPRGAKVRKRRAEEDK